MTIAAFVLVLVTPDAFDPCHEEVAAPAAPADPATAAIYRAVGDDERGAGNAAAAKFAYREALRRDSSDAGARAGLDALCREEAAANAPPPPVHRDDFERGVELLQRGDRAGAIVAFEAARAVEPDAAAALLEGICRYELGDDRGARQLLEEAQREPRVAGTALFFLGLIAMHDDDDARAASLFSAAAGSDAGIASTAAGLRRLARRDGRLVVSALAETGYDSNPELAPDGSANRAGRGDGYGSGVAGVFARPLGVVGPYARATAQYRKQLQLTSYDLGEAAAAAGVRFGGRGRFLATEYGYNYLSLGGGPYLSRHRLLAAARASHGRFTLAAAYAAHFETFLTGAAGPYSGLRHSGEAGADVQIVPRVALGLGYRLERDAARDVALSYLEHGPVAILRWGLGGSARLVAEGRIAWRGYDVTDPDLGVRRQDRIFDGIAGGELDLADNWTLRATVTARQALSNVPDFQYVKLTAALGVAYTMGVR